MTDEPQTSPAAVAERAPAGDPGPPPAVLVLLNRRSGTLSASGTGDEGERIARGFAAAGVPADVRFVDPSELVAAVEAFRAAPGDAGGWDAGVRPAGAVVVGGGDGTINTVANAVAGTGLTFAVLPLGTHNHFAKELGVPDDLDAAVTGLAAALRTGRGVRPLDVGEVNGHLFLNFSGIGLHPKLVEQREVDHEQIKRVPLLRTLLRKFTKPLALFVSFVRSLRDLRIYRLALDADGARSVRRTPSLIVCTNVHQMEVFGVADVSVPQRDVLNAYVARTRRVTGMVRLVLAAATRRLGKLREFEAVAATALTIGNRRRKMRVSVDGEVLWLATPLRYRIRPAALTVVDLCPTSYSAAAAAPAADAATTPGQDGTRIGTNRTNLHE